MKRLFSYDRRWCDRTFWKNFQSNQYGSIYIRKNLKNFENLSAHALRVIRYAGNNKLSAVADNTASKGAAVGFEGLLKFINGHLPRNPETLKIMDKSLLIQIILLWLYVK